MRFVKTVENLFGLPQGFTRVEFLESTNQQNNDTSTNNAAYIDTGVTPDSTTKIECKVQFTTLISGNSNEALFGTTGVSPSDPARMAFGFASVSPYTNFYMGLGIQNLTTSVTRDTVAHIFTIDASTSSWKIDDATGTFSNPGEVVGAAPIYLFARNYAAYEYANKPANAKLYYCKIWKNGVLIRDLVPCLDNNNVPCMYDLIGNKAYYNQGTRTFTAGRQIIPVDYLEGTGTQYIDTGVRGFADFEIGVKLRESVSNVSIFCSNNYRLERYNATNPYWRFRNNNDFYNSGISITEYHVMAWKNDEVYADGIKLQDFSKTWNVAANMTLFGISASGSYPSMIYFCKLWNPTDGTLLRDFIPCKDENDNGFLFDKVSGTCYLNAGTGSFSVGENKYTSKLRLIKDAIRLPDGYTRVEYLESTGTQYINTGVIPTDTTGVQVRHTICADNSRDNIVFGCRGGSGDTRFWEDIDWTNSDTIGWGFNSYSSTTAGTRFPISGMAGQIIVSSMNFMNDRAGRVNGVPYDTSLETKTLITITRPICLFAANYAGTMSLFTACKIFSCQISEGSTLVRSFIPVRDSNNVGYMFDEVTGQIFGNDGSGSFGIGNDLPTAKVRFIQDVLPSDYLPLKYLESTGTQYIDLGVGVKANTIFKATFSVASTATGRSYFGARNSSNERFQIVNSIGIGGGYYLANDVYPIANKKYEIEMHANGDMYLDGVKRNATTGTFSQVSFERNLWLFATNYYDSSVGPGASTFWSAIIYEGDVPVRDLYPALRKSDNKPGMYDRITKQFFTNAAESGNDFNYE